MYLYKRRKEQRGWDIISRWLFDFYNLYYYRSRGILAEFCGIMVEYLILEMLIHRNSSLRKIPNYLRNIRKTSAGNSIGDERKIRVTWKYVWGDERRWRRFLSLANRLWIELTPSSRYCHVTWLFFHSLKLEHNVNIPYYWDMLIDKKCIVMLFLFIYIIFVWEWYLLL